MSQLVESTHGLGVGVYDTPVFASPLRKIERQTYPAFSPTELAVVQAYWDGNQMEQITIPDLTRNTVRKILLGTDHYSIKERIRESTGFSWMPSGSAEVALWMYKHGYLKPLSIDIDTGIHIKRPFNDSGIMIARLYLAGYTSTKQLYYLFKGQVSESEIRNIINGSKNSISSTIYRWTNETYYPNHKLSACRWMVEKGLIPENVIGEALP